jgi:D-serine deaminase-like pyridoxal phosphate-dependent protein
LSEALIFSTQGFHNVLVSRLPAKDPNNLLESLILQCDLTVCANDLDHARNLVTYRNEKGLDFKILVRIALREIQRGISLEDYLKNLNESRSPIKYDGLFIEWDDSCTREDAEMFDQCSAGSEGVAGISEGRIIVAACASTKSVLTLPNSVTETIDGQSMWSFEKHIRTENTEKIVLGVVSSVISAPEQGLAFIDCGQKSISIDDGLPSIVGEDFLYVEQMSAEHGFLTIGDPDSSVGLADRVILNPSNISDTCNLYDYMHVLSKERLVSVWKIEARGQYF